MCFTLLVSARSHDINICFGGGPPATANYKWLERLTFLSFVLLSRSCIVIQIISVWKGGRSDGQPDERDEEVVDVYQRAVWKRLCRLLDAGCNLVDARKGIIYLGTPVPSRL